MEILIGKYNGFCKGVNYTVQKARELLENGQKIYCLGELVHNEGVIKDLEQKGLIFINSIDEAKESSNVIFRAHGESLEIYEKANAKNINIIDLTCGKVKAIHTKVEKNSKDAFIIIVGKKSHPEIIGTKGFAGDSSIVITDISEVNDAYKIFKMSNLSKVYVCSQTTFSIAKFNKIVSEIEKSFKNVEIIVDNTICDSTTNRQLEVEELAKKSSIVVVVGGKNSSNTKELYNIAILKCPKVYIIQNKEDLLDITFMKDDVVAVVSGASTPIDIVDEIVDELKVK